MLVIQGREELTLVHRLNARRQFDAAAAGSNVTGVALQRHDRDRR